MSTSDLIFDLELEKIRNIKGNHTECISLYVPSSRNVSDVLKYLNNELKETSNVKDKNNRKNIMSAITKISE